MSNIIGHIKIKDAKGNVITDEELVFTPVEIETDNPYDNSKEEYKTLLKRRYDTD